MADLDLGEPIAYPVLERGTPVYGADGERIGRVQEIRADTNLDIFDGIVVDGELIPADRVEEIYERGVQLRPGAG